MTRLLIVLSFLGLACGDSDSLAVRGDVLFTAPDGAEAGGFQFPSTRDLVDDRLVTDATERFAGHCEYAVDGADNEVVSVAILRPNAQAVAFQPRRIQLVLPVDAGTGTVEVDLGGNDFAAVVDGASCSATLDYVVRADERDAGIAGVTFDCTMSGAEGDARAAGELHFEGCR